MTATLPSLASLQPNPAWASLPLFDRTGWKRVRFGDVVENCAETCDPEEAGLERFVAMEHLEPGSLHVRSWGNVADGTTFTRRCRPGQVLFGKRRAYQRKVAVAEFEAVVSGDIYVLAPKDDRLLPELLPFLCLSERFFQHAVGTSAGSLSPRTNWSSLASFEFDLPPLDQQRRIAEILWAVDEACESQLRLRSDLSEHLRALRRSLYVGNKYKMVQVRDVGDKSRQVVQVGPFGGSLCSRHFVSEGVPVVKVNNIAGNNEIDLTEAVFVSQGHANSLARYAVRAGDVLIAAQGDTTGRSGLAGEESHGAIISQHLARVAVDHQACRPRFLAELFRADELQRQVDAVKLKTTRPGLNTDDVAAFWIPLPKPDEQDRFCDEARASADSIKACSEAANSGKALCCAIINSFMSP